MCCLSVCGCVFIYFIFHYYLFIFFKLLLRIYLFFPYLMYVVTGPGFGTCCPLACLCCSRWGGALPLPAARGFTLLWARLDSRGTWPGALGQALAHCAWLSGALGPLGYWVEPLPGGLGALRLLGAWFQRTAHVWVAGACRGRWAVAPGSWGASALCLWGLFPGASSAVFWVDAWLSLRWASRVLCSVGAAGGLGLVALSACF